jgi:hypothetical protein
MSEPLPERCPNCGIEDETVFHQVYSGENFVFCHQEPTTFGQQAEANAKRVGKEQMEKMAEEYKEANHKAKMQNLPAGAKPMKDKYKAEKPWWRDTDQPLDVSKIRDTKKYILEGKTT